MPAEIKKGPFGRFGVDVDNGFEAYYVVDSDKKKKVSELKRLLKGADELYLATDEDREGEAIAWHLLEVLKPKVPGQAHGVPRDHQGGHPARRQQHPRPRHRGSSTRRRPAASSTASTATRSRPVLWRKVKAGLSAGRVQSVATRIVVERERERMAFVRASYWDVEGDFTPTAPVQPVHRPPEPGRRRPGRHRPRLRRRRLAQGQGRRPPRRGDRQLHRRQVISGRQVKPSPASRRSPTPGGPRAPFTTSTLQQEASRKLRLSSKNAMRVAQRLYENGYITYMRTDSTTLSEAALTAARQQARDLYGAEYVPDVAAPLREEGQERPGGARGHPSRRRPVPHPGPGRRRAARRRVRPLRADLEAHRRLADGRRPRLDRDGQARRHPRGRPGRGVQRVAARSSPSAASSRPTRRAATRSRSARDARRPTRSVACPSSARAWRSPRCAPRPTATRPVPPPRYTEATLVKAMEEKGIGRPSTYASTVGTIQDRGYVNTRGNALIPTWLAFAVTRLLEEHFSRAGRLRLHRLHGGGPRPHRRRRRAAGRSGSHRFYFGGEGWVRAVDGHRRRPRRRLRPGPQAPRRGPRRDRRPRDLHHPHRRGHRRARRALRPLRRGDRAAGRRPVDRRDRATTRPAPRVAPRSTTTSPPTR